MVLPLRLYVRADASGLGEQTDFNMVVTSKDGAVSASTGVRFEAPEASK